MSRYEKKLKGKMDDEIKLAGLGALVPEELEKHLILNSNRLRIFEDARLEIVTYVEAKFGLTIRDSSRVTRVCVNTQTPWMLCGQLSLVSQRNMATRSARRVFFSAVSKHIFNEIAMQARTLASNRPGKGNRSKS